MTRARWLGLTHSTRPNAVPRRVFQRHAVLGALRDVAIAICVIGFVLWGFVPFMNWAADDISRDPAVASTLSQCAPPTEHEQLHVVIVSRNGQLFADCQYVGPRGAYQRGRAGMPEPRP